MWTNYNGCYIIKNLFIKREGKEKKKILTIKDFWLFIVKIMNVKEKLTGEKAQNDMFKTTCGLKLWCKSKTEGGMKSWIRTWNNSGPQIPTLRIAVSCLHMLRLRPKEKKRKEKDIILRINICMDKWKWLMRDHSFQKINFRAVIYSI